MARTLSGCGAGHPERVPRSLSGKLRLINLLVDEFLHLADAQRSMLSRAVLRLVPREAVQVVLASLAASCLALAASAQVPPVTAVAPDASVAPDAPDASAAAAALPSALQVVPSAPPTFQVDVLVKGLRRRGRVLGGLYNGAAHWPEEPGSMAHCATPVRGTQVVCSFTIPARPGLYAAAFFQDEDGDGDIDTGFLGIPTEGYAFSRDAHAALSAPSFAAGAFHVPVRTPVFATMRY